MDLSKYDVLAIKQNEENLKEIDDALAYVSSILNDRSIPERNKLGMRRQFNELIAMRNILQKPPMLILKEKE